LIVNAISLDRITIGDRARQEMRNIDSLAKSIKERGLLQPIVVRPDGGGYALVAGGRRIEAHRLLGRDTIDAHVAGSLADELEALLAEGEENTEREAFTPTEAVEHAERIRGIEEQRAAERRLAGQRAGGPQAAKARLAADPEAPVLVAVEPEAKSTLGGNFPPSVVAAEAPKPSLKTRDQIAKATGMSGRTLEKARHVVEAARDLEAPEPVREAAREAQAVMDRTGKVDPAFKKVKQAEADALVAPVRDYLESSGAAEEIRRKQWQHNFQKELARSFGLIGMFTPEQVAAGADERQMEDLRQLAKSVADYVGRIEALRERPAGLSLIVGG
jgi:ParB-like chromosome segregation protein Spo0J